MKHSRRDLFHVALGTGYLFTARQAFSAGTNFWDKKPPQQWSASEIEKLKTNSPWARKTPLNVKSGKGAAMDTNGSPGTFGGMRGADSNGISEVRRGRGSAGGAPENRTPEVIVRWESAQPMLGATGWIAPPAFANSYAISVTGLPKALVIMAVRGGGAEEPAANPQTGIQRLLADTKLISKGHDAQTAELVVESSDRASLIFGFRKPAQPLSMEDKEILFQMELGVASLHARFEPKTMTCNGQLAL